jgi:hypothetical protein
MKRGLFGLLAIVLFVQIGNAQEENDLDEKCDFKCGSIITTFNKETIEYKFRLQDDLSQEVEEIINEFDLSSSENIKDVCEIMIELKIEIGIGVTTILISEKIKASCENEARAMIAKKLKTLINVTSTG